MIIDQILPDGFRVAPAGKAQFDNFPPGLTCAGGCGPTGNRIGCGRAFTGGLRAEVGDHLIGRFCRIAPTPGTGRSNRNTSGPQIAADRFAPDVYGLFNAPQRPAQPSQRDDLLSLCFAQDIAHVDGGVFPTSGSMSRISSSVGRFSGDHHWPVLGDPQRILNADDFKRATSERKPFRCTRFCNDEGKGEKLEATATNESGKVIQYARICILPAAAQKDCLFELKEYRALEARR